MSGISSWTNIDTTDGDAQKVEGEVEMVSDHLRALCIDLGLTLAIRGATTDMAQRYFVLKTDKVIIQSDDPMQVEYYLYGWRDRQNTTSLSNAR